MFSYLPVGCGVLGAAGAWMVDVEGTEVIGPLFVASVAIGALGAESLIDLLVPGKTRRKQERVEEEPPREVLTYSDVGGKYQ